jgi:hypothetical protein
MSLKPLQAALPLGQFDGLDTEVLTLKGGEVVTFTGTVVPGDKAAYDVFDGYIPPSSRAVVTRTVPAASRPLMLADEGIAGYGTLFGAVVGGTVGQQVNGPNTFTGALLGPHTATGSGKVTCWGQPGLYAISLDATDTNIATGLQPTNSNCTPGSAIYWATAGATPGVLTTLSGSNSSGAGNTVGRLVEFNTNGSLVTTPNTLVAALNSPSGNVSSVGPKSFTYATIWFSPVL